LENSVLERQFNKLPLQAQAFDLLPENPHHKPREWHARPCRATGIKMTQANPDEIAPALQALRPEIRTMLSEDLPEDRSRAEQAYSRQEWAALHSHIHRINGSASFCKLGVLKTLCSEIEVGLNQERLPTAEAMQGFYREVARVLEALEAFVGTE
jgi:HPt (histidine-containing phosphotransfer) domain-containing protein